MEKKASTVRSTARLNWGSAFVFNKSAMGGGSLAEGRRQRGARSGDLVIGKAKPLTTKGTKEIAGIADIRARSWKPTAEGGGATRPSETQGKMGLVLPIHA